MNETEAAGAVLTELLRPVQPILDDPDLTNFDIRPGRGFVDRGRGMEQIPLPFSYRDLEDIALYAAAYTQQDISEREPIVAGGFPNDLRVHILIPPAVMQGDIAMAIRKPKPHTGTPAKLRKDGVFDGAVKAGTRIPPWRVELKRLYDSGDYEGLISKAVERGLNVVFSGKVDTGKTHVLRSFTHCIPLDAKIVTVADMHELIGMPHPNILHMFYSTGGQGASNVTAESLVRAALRLGLQWMINQELRDGAAYAYMDVLESGHSGLTTIHANSASEARSRIRGLIKKHPVGMSMRDDDIMLGLYRSIDLVVHCIKETMPDGSKRRRIAEVLYDPEVQDQLADAPAVFAKAA